MAKGTKMTLHRYNGRVQDWKDQIVQVDNSIINNLIYLDYPYEVGSQMLEVFLNGQRLNSGAGYIEIDDTTIQIDLGLGEDGLPILLEPGIDEIYIKFWNNHYYNRGGNQPSAIDVTEILKTIEEIVNYGGASNLSTEYTYNEKSQIVREVSTGGHNVIREFTYNAIGEMDTERIYYDGKVIDKTYEYDLDTARLLKTTVRVV